MKGIKKIDENVIAAYRSLTITNPSLIDNTNWQVGTLKCDPEHAGLSYKVNSSGSFSYFDATKMLLGGTITSDLIQDGTIQTIDLKDLCVTNDKIDDNTIKGGKLVAGTLTDREMAAQSISNRALQEGCISDNKIAEKAILNRSLSDGCIEYRNMAANSVGTLHLVDSSVTEEILADESVSTRKLRNAAVTNEKIAPYTILGGEMNEIRVNDQLTMVQGNIAQGTITSYNIANYTISSMNIADGAVTNRTIGNEEIYGNKIKQKSVQTTHMADGAITGVKVAANSITGDKLADRSISIGKVDNQIANVITNAIIYDADGNVQMSSADMCNVKIGTEDAFGNSMGNGSLRVYGDIRADRVYNMAYSDLAEGYIPGEELEPGDIVEIREDGKVYKSFSNGIKAAIVGVVSDEYAACYGATKEEILSGEKVAVALVGKIHVKCKGPISIGDEIRINNLPGIGVTWSLNKHVIGTALETIPEDGIHRVLCLVRPN